MLKANFWFTTKLTDAVEKKFQSKVHHHKNVVKSAQHHRLAPGALPQDMLDKILNHTLTVVKRRNLVSFINYALDLFQVEFSHLYNPQTMKFMLIAHILLVSNTNLLELHFCPFQSTSTSPQRSSSRYMWGKTIFYLSGTQNLFKQSPILTYTHASTLGTLSFAKEGSSLPKSLHTSYWCQTQTGSNCIFAPPNPLQLHRKGLHHARCGVRQSSSHRALKIFSNNLQF